MKKKLKTLTILLGFSILCLSPILISAQNNDGVYIFNKISNNQNGKSEYNLTNNSFSLYPDLKQNSLSSIDYIDGSAISGNLSSIITNDGDYLMLEPAFSITQDNQYYHRYDNVKIIAEDFDSSDRLSEDYAFYENQTIGVPISDNTTLPSNFTNDVECMALRTISYAPRYRNISNFVSTGIQLEGDITLAGYTPDTKSTFLNLTLTDLTATPSITFNFDAPTRYFDQKSNVILQFMNPNAKQLTFTINGTSYSTSEMFDLFTLPYNSIINQITITFSGSQWELSDNITLTSCFILYPESFVENITLNHFTYIQNGMNYTLNQSHNVHMQLDLAKSLLQWNTELGCQFNLYYKLMVSQIPNYNSSLPLTIPKQKINCSINYYLPQIYPDSFLTFEVYGITYDYQGKHRLNVEFAINLSLITNITYLITTSVPGYKLNLTGPANSYSTNLMLSLNNGSLSFNLSLFDKLILTYENDTSLESGNLIDAYILLVEFKIYTLSLDPHLISIGINSESIWTKTGTISLTYQSNVNLNISISGTNYVLLAEEQTKRIQCQYDSSKPLNISIIHKNQMEIQLSNITFTENTTSNTDSTPTGDTTSTSNPFEINTDNLILAGEIVGGVLVVGGLLYGISSSKKRKN